MGVGEWWEEDEEWLEEFPGDDAGGRTPGDVSGVDDAHADVVEVGGADVHRESNVAGGGKKDGSQEGCGK